MSRWWCWIVNNLLLFSNVLLITFPSSNRQKSESKSIALGVIKQGEQKQISEGSDRVNFMSMII